MSTTPILETEEMTPSQSQPHLIVNAALRRLEVFGQIVALSRIDPTDSPFLPEDGDVYLVPESTTIPEWAGHENEIAYYAAGWYFIAARAGWTAYVVDEDLYYRVDVGSPLAWVPFAVPSDAYAVDYVSSASPGPSSGISNAGDALDELYDLAQIAADDIALAAPIASPLFTGTPRGPTAAGGTNTTQLATTAFVEGEIASKAPIASPTFTGTPAAPTASGGTNTTQLATTAFVQAAITALGGGLVFKGTWNATTNTPAIANGTGTIGWFYKVATAGTTNIDGNAAWNIGDVLLFDGTTWDRLEGDSTEVTSVAGRTGAVTLAVADVSGAAALASPALTGTPTAPTAAAATNTTQLATTAFVQTALGGGGVSVTTKGDLQTFTTVPARLAVGTDGYALVADSTQTTGLKYAQVGYINVPQNSQSAAYTTVLADQGKHILHPAADTTARTFTIDSNANVAYPIGTAITFINQNAAGVITIAITSDTMRLAGAGTTGNRTLAANGVATAIKITSTEWIISGTGLT